MTIRYAIQTRRWSNRVGCLALAVAAVLSAGCDSIEVCDILNCDTLVFADELFSDFLGDDHDAMDDDHAGTDDDHDGMDDDHGETDNDHDGMDDDHGETDDGHDAMDDDHAGTDDDHDATDDDHDGTDDDHDGMDDDHDAGAL